MRRQAGRPRGAGPYLARAARPLLALAALTVLAALAVEFVLRSFPVFPINYLSNRVADPRLGYRLDPAFPEVDAEGFRNPDGKAARFRVAAVGDSMTFGSNVRSGRSWPARFEARTGLPTYNFGVSGYGPFAYHALVREALARGRGRGVIVAVYLGDDFRPYLAHCAIDSGGPFWRGELDRLGIEAPACARPPDAGRGGPLAKATAFLVRHSAAFNALKALVWDRLARRPDPTDADAADGGKGQGEDAARMLEAFARMAADWGEESRRSGSPVGVLLVPSKRRVIRAASEGGGALPGGGEDPGLERSLRDELWLEAGLATAVGRAGLPLASALPELGAAVTEAVARGESGSVYPTFDDHPLAPGYDAIAAAADRLWRRMAGRWGGGLAEPAPLRPRSPTDGARRSMAALDDAGR